MTTQQSQDFYVKTIDTNDESLYTTIYDATSGAPFRVKTEMLGHYLEKTKRSLALVGKELNLLANGKKHLLELKKKLLVLRLPARLMGLLLLVRLKLGSEDEVGEVRRNDNLIRQMGNHHKTD